MGEDNMQEIASLHMKKDTGPFTPDEIEAITSNFLNKVIKSEMEKMMEDVIFCPIMSQVQLGPGPVQNTVKPVAMQAICFKQQCGFWSLCPRNSDSPLIGIIESFNSFGKPIPLESE